MNMDALITTLGTITWLVLLSIVGGLALAAIVAVLRVVYLFTRDNPEIMRPVLIAFAVGIAIGWWL